MSSLLEQASLVITPNAYKEGKLYGLKGTDLNVVRATTATRVNAEGLIESVANNVPRLDYTNGSCPSILVEPQRTNVFTYSEQFDNAAWTKTRSTLTANATTAPDGNTTSDFLTQETGETSAGNVSQSFTNTIGVTYTFSVFAKKNTKNFIGLRSNSVGAGISYFDLLNGTLGIVNASHTAKIESYNDDWYRCSITYTATVVSFLNLIYIADSSSTIVTDSGGVYLWGAQLEVGSNATSYIPTVASAVTRNADVISKTGIADLIGQSEGTLFVDVELDNFSDKDILIIDNGLPQDFITIGRSTNGNFRLILRKNFVSSQVINSSIFTSLGRVKIAVSYESGNQIMYVNGLLAGTSTHTTNFPTLELSRLNISTSPYSILNDNLNSTILFKTRLSNSELATLTTL